MSCLPRQLSGEPRAAAVPTRPAPRAVDTSNRMTRRSRSARSRRRSADCCSPATARPTTPCATRCTRWSSRSDGWPARPTTPRPRASDGWRHRWAASRRARTCCAASPAPCSSTWSGRSRLRALRASRPHTVNWRSRCGNCTPGRSCARRRSPRRRSRSSTRSMPGCSTQGAPTRATSTGSPPRTCVRVCWHCGKTASCGSPAATTRAARYPIPSGPRRHPRTFPRRHSSAQHSQPTSARASSCR